MPAIRTTPKSYHISPYQLPARKQEKDLSIKGTISYELPDLADLYAPSITTEEPTTPEYVGNLTSDDFLSFPTSPNPKIFGEPEEADILQGYGDLHVGNGIGQYSAIEHLTEPPTHLPTANDLPYLATWFQGVADQGRQLTREQHEFSFALAHPYDDYWTLPAVRNIFNATQLPSISEWLEYFVEQGVGDRGRERWGEGEGEEEDRTEELLAAPDKAAIQFILN